MQANTFDVMKSTKHITMFKVGKYWIFKYFFDDKESFKELADHYDKNGYRFVLKTLGERNKALKLLERKGFDIDLVEDLKGYVVKLGRTRAVLFRAFLFSSPSAVSPSSL